MLMRINYLYRDQGNIQNQTNMVLKHLNTGKSNLLIFSFSKDHRDQNLRPMTPGPGQYMARKLVREGPKYSVGKGPRTISSSRTANTIGPGSYSAKFYDKPKSAVMLIGKSQRDIIKKDPIIVPGPGMYEPKIENKVKKFPAYR